MHEWNARIPPVLKARRILRWTICVSLLLTVVLLPHVAGAQTPPPLLPGETPDVSRPYATYWLAFVVLAGIAGLVLALGFAYWRLSSRFYGREEPPPVRPRPRFAGMAAAQPMAAAPQGAASAQPGAAAAARADSGAAVAVQAPADAETPSTASAPATEPAAPAKASEAAGEKPAAEEPAEKPAEPPIEKPAETAAEKPAASAAPATGHVEPDQETFDRVLQEQIDKGVDRRVAEGRAKAAAVRAAREKAGAG